MKQAKQRVVAIDYFRGVCILVILLSHASLYTRPFSYISGMGRLWLSAAEIFFLLSGLTLGIVRGNRILTEFTSVRRKSWLRARNLYFIYLFSAAASLVIFSVVPLDNFITQFGFWTTANWSSLLVQILTLQTLVGLANFLGFYAVYMIFAPFVLYAIYKYRRLWVFVPVVSALLFFLNTSYPFHLIPHNQYSQFAIWQFYLVIGMTLSRFLKTMTGWFYSQNQKIINITYRAITTTAAATLFVSVIMGFNLAPVINRLTADGWLPHKIYGAYLRIANHRIVLDNLLMNSRTGVLRPLVTLLIITAAYLIFQRHRKTILRYSGQLITSMGRDTLWIFVAQSLVIPIMYILPPSTNLIRGSLITGTLIGSMWLLTKRRAIMADFWAYTYRLKNEYYRAKYGYLSQFEDI